MVLTDMQNKKQNSPHTEDEKKAAQQTQVKRCIAIVLIGTASVIALYYMLNGVADMAFTEYPAPEAAVQE